MKKSELVTILKGNILSPHNILSANIYCLDVSAAFKFYIFKKNALALLEDVKNHEKDFYTEVGIKQEDFKVEKFTRGDIEYSRSKLDLEQEGMKEKFEKFNGLMNEYLSQDAEDLCKDKLTYEEFFNLMKANPNIASNGIDWDNSLENILWTSENDKPADQPAIPEKKTPICS